MTEEDSENEFQFDEFPETDLTLILEGKQIHVNKGVLKHHSPVFKNMFEGDFKEKDAKVLELKDKSYDDFRVFLRCFYPNMEHPLTESSVLQVYPLAHEYQIPLLLKTCEKFLQEKAFTFRDQSESINLLIKYTCLAEKYNIKLVLDTAIISASHKRLSALTSNENRQEYSLLSEKTRLRIAENRIRIVEKQVLLSPLTLKTCRRIAHTSPSAGSTYIEGSQPFAGAMGKDTVVDRRSSPSMYSKRREEISNKSNRCDCSVCSFLRK